MNPSAASYTPTFLAKKPYSDGQPSPSSSPATTVRYHSQHVSPALLPKASAPLSAADRIRLSSRAALDGNAVGTTTTSSSAPSGKIRYTKEQLLAIADTALESIEQGPIVDAPPFLKIPAAFAELLQLPHALEYLDVSAATVMVERRPYVKATMSTSGADDDQSIRSYSCRVCAQGGEAPCAALDSVLNNATKYVLSSRRGACLLQSGDVVWGLLQLALVFESKKSSMRLRLLAERHPNIVALVKEYLCGEGYHIPIPPVTAHEEWRSMMRMLRFDALRDNRTRIVTDLSKHWKKRHTPFEQFVFFFSFRDDRPNAPVRNVLTRNVKPVIAAMLCGDVVAMLLLHKLNFFTPPDYYWSLFPFLGQALGEGTLAFDVVRHLGLYFSCRQSAHMFNPVESPFVPDSSSSTLLMH